MGLFPARMEGRTTTCSAYVSMILGGFECLFFGVLYIGWPNLVFVYKNNGLFREMCTSNNTSTAQEEYESCSAADNNYNLSLNIAIAICQASSLISGIIFDKFGLLVIRLLSTLCFVPGMLMLSFAGNAGPDYLIFPGLSLVSVAGYCLVVQIGHISLPAGKKHSTVTAIYAGAMDSSTFMFLFVKLLYEKAYVPHQYSLWFITGLWSIVLINTLFFLPRYKLQIETTSIESAHHSADVNSISNVISNKEYPSSEKDVPVHVQVQPERSFKDCLKSPIFLLLLVWFCILQLRLIFFVGSLNIWLEFHLTNNEVSHFLSMFGYFTLGGIVFAPAVGAINDKCLAVGFGNGVNDPWISRAKVGALSLWIASILSIIHAILLLFFSNGLLYADFAMFAISRSFVYGGVVTFIPLVFPPQWIGKCTGLTFFVGGTFSWIQYAFFSWVNNSQNFLLVNGTMLAITVGSLAFPMYIEWTFYYTKKYQTGTSTQNIIQSTRL